MSAAMTRAPARAKASALARPMPDPAAVTIAVLPESRSDSIGGSRGSGIDQLVPLGAEPDQQHFPRLVPLVVGADQLANRPVATPHESARAEHLQQVIDAGRELRGVCAARFGDQAGQFAYGVGAAGDGLDFVAPLCDVATAQRRLG